MARLSPLLPGCRRVINRNIDTAYFLHLKIESLYLTRSIQLVRVKIKETVGQFVARHGLYDHVTLENVHRFAHAADIADHATECRFAL